MLGIGFLCAFALNTNHRTYTYWHCSSMIVGMPTKEDRSMEEENIAATEGAKMKAKTIKGEYQDVDEAFSPLACTEQSNKIVKPANPNKQVILRDYKNFRFPMETQLRECQQLNSALILLSSMSDSKKKERIS